MINCHVQKRKKKRLRLMCTHASRIRQNLPLIVNTPDSYDGEKKNKSHLSGSGRCIVWPKSIEHIAEWVSVKPWIVFIYSDSHMFRVRVMRIFAAKWWIHWIYWLTDIMCIIHLIGMPVQTSFGCHFFFFSIDYYYSRGWIWKIAKFLACVVVVVFLRLLNIGYCIDQLISLFDMMREKLIKLIKPATQIRSFEQKCC